MASPVRISRPQKLHLMVRNRPAPIEEIRNPVAFYILCRRVFVETLNGHSYYAFHVQLLFRLLINKSLQSSSLDLIDLDVCFGQHNRCVGLGLRDPTDLLRFPQGPDRV